MTDHIRNEIAAWVDSEYGNCPVSASELLALIDAQATEIKQLRAELAKPADIAAEMSTVADQFAHRLALDLECVLADYSGTWYDTAISTLGAYRKAMNAIHERESPTFMGEPVLLDIAASAPAWRDAPETVALQLELASAKESYLNACKLVADMHAAAVEEVTGPRLGVVEDVIALKAERDAAMKDAERLDYLQKHARCDPKMDGNHVWWPTTFNQAQNLRGETLREAIDAAIAKAEGRTE